MLLNSDGTVSDKNHQSEKVLDEKTSRQRLCNFAQERGCLKEVLIIFAKYDKLIRNCTNEKEKKDMVKLAIVEIFKCFGNNGGTLVVDGETVIK